MNLKNKNIVFIISGTALGGAERQSILLARGLRQRGNANIRFICFGKDEGRATELLKEYKISYSIVKYVNFHNWKHTLFAPFYFFIFLRELRSLEPDIILPYCYDANLWSGLAGKFLSRNTILIWNQRDEGRGIKLTWILKKSLEGYDHLIANSDQGAVYLREDLTVPAEEISVIYNGVEAFCPAVTREEWRKMMNYGEQDFLAVMIANLHAHKDHYTLIEAWDKVMKAVPDGKRYKLLLAGYKGNTYELLLDMVKKKGLEDQVVFMGPVNDIPSLLQGVDLSILCTFDKSEGLPNAVLESMAAALPVIGTNTDALKCALADNMKKWLSPLRDPVLLSANILELIKDSQLREHIGQENKARQLREFSAEALWDTTEKLLINQIHRKNYNIP